MAIGIRRCDFLRMMGGGGLLSTLELAAQQAPSPVPAVPIKEYPRRSAVALVHGENRRKNVHDALGAIDKQILPLLRKKKRVLVKVNAVNVKNQLSCTHADALRGILDYLTPRYKGPVTIADSSQGNTSIAFENFQYARMIGEYKSLAIDLVDFDAEGKYVTSPLLTRDLHLTPVRLAARMLDPEAFIICSTCMKAHDVVVATLSVKNMAVGAPLKSPPGAASRWSDKRLYHVGPHLANYNILATAQVLQPYWGVTVIDGFEGMEGNGPMSGTPVPSRVAIASTDYVAADRVGVECMGLDPNWVGYLQYCGQAGLGNYDLAKIDLLGPAIASVQRKYALHKDVERQLQWMAPAKVTEGI
jgi:uncharacterized protein (DUF362 family)